MTRNTRNHNHDNTGSHVRAGASRSHTTRKATTMASTRKETALERAQREAEAKLTKELRAEGLLDWTDPDSDEAAYARMSKAIGTDGKGIGRDGVDLVRDAKARGKRLRPDPETGLPVHVDNSISASQYGRGKVKDDNRRRRPAYGRLIEAVESGAVSRINVPHTDRLYRHPRDLEELLAFVERQEITGRPFEIAETRGLTLDLNTSDGRVAARMFVALAAHQSDRTHDRIVNDNNKRREQGWWLGGLAPMGYVRIDEYPGIVPDPVVGPIITQAGRDLVRGVSLSEIARQWNELPLTRPRNAVHGWDAAQVAQRLRAPAIAGRYAHGKRKGTHIREEGGRGGWLPLVDDETWSQMRLAFDANRKRYGTTRRKGAFTGLFVCGGCGRPLYRMKSYDKQRRTNGHRWVCLTRVSEQACGKVAVSGPAAEKWTRDEAMRVLSAANIADDARALDDDGKLEAAQSELRAAQARLLMVERGYESGDLAYDSLVRMSRTLNAEIEAAHEHVAEVQRSLYHADMPLDFDAELFDDEQWSAMSTDEQARLLAIAFPYGVAVVPNGHSGNRFDPERMRPVTR